jgi:hypothetical protein
MRFIMLCTEIFVRRRMDRRANLNGHVSADRAQEFRVKTGNVGNSLSGWHGC